MVENAKMVLLLGNSSKIEKDPFFSFVPESMIDYLNTDKKIKNHFVKEYSRNKI